MNFMKNTVNYNLLLHNVNDFDLCLKENIDKSCYFEVDLTKHSYFNDGRIYIAPTEENEVEWLNTLNSYTDKFIDSNLYKNKSNKAVMMLKYLKDEVEFVFSLVFGYGRTMLNEQYIVKNFGLRTAVNLIEESNIKSLNSLNISTDYLDIQRQAFSYGSHSDLHVDTNADILKSISGRASSNSNYSMLNGADNLRFSAKSDVTLSDLLNGILDAFFSENYKEKGLEWIDHVQYVKEKEMISELDGVLLDYITDKELENPIIAPNKIVSYLDIEGYFISGMNISHKTKENFYDDIPSNQFWDFLSNKSEDNILDKLQSSSLYCWLNDSPHKISSIYNCLFLEIEYNDEKFFINNGDWFKIESSYYELIVNKVDSIEVFKDQAIPCCEKDWNEGEFNKKFVESAPARFKLFDKENFHMKEFGYSKIEPADIITQDKQLIHVKKGGSSATLSHLFAQGVVSAQLYKNELLFIDKINEFFEEGYFKPDDDIEVIYGVIDKRFTKKASKILPFFSMVNLSQHYDHLSNMGVRCRLLFIEQKVSVYNKKEERILGRVVEVLGDHEKTSSELFELLNGFLMENKIRTKNTFKNKYLEKFVTNGNLLTDGATRNRKYRKQVTT